MRRVTVWRSSILSAPLQMLGIILCGAVASILIFVFVEDRFHMILMTYCFLALSVMPIVMIISTYTKFHRTRPNLLCSHKSVEDVPDGVDALNHFSEKDDAK